MPQNCIVVIDDEQGACDFVGSFLSDRGYAVHTALDGEAGLRLIRQKMPALVFLDIKMPGMSGVKVLTELRKDDQTTKVVIITGVEEGEEIETAEKLGVTAVLNKPLQLTELSKIIHEHVKQ